jgi:hypothetical protein
MKCRGTFSSKTEACDRSESIIRNFDSYNKIHTAWVGRPFPICVDSEKWTVETAEVDIKKQIQQSFSKKIKNEEAEERKIKKEIREQEERLLADVKEDKPDDPEENYTTLRVKRANLVFSYVETMKKIEIMKKSIISARAEIDELDISQPELRNSYVQRYNDAREAAGIPIGDQFSDENFYRYMGDDIILDFERPAPAANQP